MKAYTSFLPPSRQQCHVITPLREHHCWVFPSRNMTIGSSQVSAALLPDESAKKLAQCIQKQLAQCGQHLRQAVQLARTRGVGIVLGKDPELYSLVPLKALDLFFDTFFLNCRRQRGSQDCGLLCTWQQQHKTQFEHICLSCLASYLSFCQKASYIYDCGELFRQQFRLIDTF